MSDSWSFPDDWPECCPPDDSIEASGQFFAGAKSHPFTDADFTSAAKRGAFKGRDECQRQGVSLLQDPEDANHFLKLYRRRFAVLAVIELAARHGKLKKTDSKFPSHHTLWPHSHIDLHDEFVLA